MVEVGIALDRRSDDRRSDVPGQPERVNVRPLDGAVTVTWERPPAGTHLTCYDLTPCRGATPIPERTVTVDGSASSGMVRGLVNGTTYTVRVTPWRGQVPGPSAVSPAFEPYPAPGEPLSVVATAGEQSAVVRWQPPVTGGPVEGYRIVASPSGPDPIEVPGSQHSALVSGLPNRARHTFTVSAVNGAGEGVSAPSNPVWAGDDVPGYLFPLEFGYLLVLGLAALLYALRYPPQGIAVPYLGTVSIPALRDLVPATVAGVPVSIPWFGALGAVLIGLYGIFEHGHRDWERRLTPWHVARPFTGAALGAVAYIVFAGIIRATGVVPVQDSIGKLVYFAVAFIAGFRESTFRQLIARVADVVVGPGLAKLQSVATPTPAPSQPKPAAAAPAPAAPAPAAATATPPAAEASSAS